MARSHGPTLLRRLRWQALLATPVLAALVTGAMLVRSDSSRADSASTCAPCVVLIQVDGLDPKDVSEQTTPFLWSLAHPGGTTSSTPPVPSNPALSGRAGFIWQAPRGGMTAGTASATASLLTGSDSSQTDVPSNDYWLTRPGAATSQEQILAPSDATAGGSGPASISAQSFNLFVQPAPATLFDILANNASGTGAAPVTGAYLGDAAVAPIIGTPSTEWTPATNSSGNASDPALCSPTEVAQQSTSGSPPSGQPQCPAPDAATVAAALQDINTADTNAKPQKLTFIHLAELGAVKRQDGAAVSSVNPNSACTTTTGSVCSVRQALSDLDGAVSAFVTAYSQDTAINQYWQKTVLMLVGDHGYETTPPSQRVPNPVEIPQGGGQPADPSDDLANFVATDSGAIAQSINGGQPSTRAVLVPQGTVGTVYWKGATGAELATLAKDIKQKGNAACDGDPNAGQGSDCIAKVYATHPGIGAADDTAAPTEDGSTAGVCDDQTSSSNATGEDETAGQEEAGDDPNAPLPWSWFLDGQGKADPTTCVAARTGTAGDLIVLTENGWALGRAVPSTNGVQTPPQYPVTNADLASDGGPNNRAVAALIDGPSSTTAFGNGIQQVTSDRQPVASGDATPVASGAGTTCNSTVDAQVNDAQGDSDAPNLPGFHSAKASDFVHPGDDAWPGESRKSSLGYECQAQTVDFAPSIAALLSVALPTTQIAPQARFLNEAFLHQLGFPVETVDLGTPPPEPPPPPPPSLPPLPPPIVEPSAPIGDSFTFKGLMRYVRATVVDEKGNTYAAAPHGALMSTIRLTGDFGRPHSLVTLTFYRERHRFAPSRGAAAQAAARITVRLVAIARFNPFGVDRGHVTLKLKIPAAFSPDRIGVTVQETSLTAGAITSREAAAAKVKSTPDLQRLGPLAGAIVPISDAAYLHKRKQGFVRTAKAPGRRSGVRRAPGRRNASHPPGSGSAGTGGSHGAHRVH